MFQDAEEMRHIIAVREVQVEQNGVIEPETLVSELAQGMRSRKLDWENTKEWTAALKDCLRKMLEQEGSNITDVLYSDAAHDNHEFLLDIVVWTRRDEEGEGVTIAVESEWSQHVSSIAEDFWKLLVVKSPIKLMIFACNKRPRTFSQDAVWEKISECLHLYRDHVAGERYVFMDYAPTPGRRAWWIEIPENGRLKSIPERKWIDFE